MKINNVWPVITEKENSLPFTLTSLGKRGSQEHVQRFQGHSDYHWLHCTKGNGRLILEGKEYNIGVNDGFFFYPEVPHEYYPTKEPWESNYITFIGNSIDVILKLLEIPRFGVFSLNDLTPIQRIMEEMSYTSTTSSPLKSFLNSSLVYRFIVQLKESISLGEQRKNQSKYFQLQPIIEYIEKNYSNNPTLDELSALIKITPQHLCRVFKDTFKMRPFEYLTLFRIHKAKELLDTPSNLSIYEISKIVGYNDMSYFCHIFKQHEGKTPTEFKYRYSLD